MAARSLRQVAAETRRVERAAHADDAALGQAGGLMREVGHGIHRVRYDDEYRAGRIFQSLAYDAADDIGVGADKLLARHARLARYTRRHDDDIRAGRLLVVVGNTRELGLEIHGGRCLEHIEHLALRESLLDIDQHYLAGYLAACQNVGTRRTYCAGAYNSNF